LPELELLVALTDLDGAKLAGPIVDVLEQMAMDRAEVSKVEVAARHRLGRAVGDIETLDDQDHGIDEAKAVSERYRPWLNVRIVAVPHFLASLRASA
jgi:hypothetical protein